MLKKVTLGLAALVAILCGVIAMQPASFSISRSIAIAASPGDVFPHVNDLRRWEHWSPWAKIDSQMKSTYEGPEQGMGASHHWVGNNQVGEGRMTIIESVPAEKIVLRLDFIKPMAAVNRTEIVLIPEGPSTTVKWTMSGENGFLSKAVGMIMDMDAMLGEQFEHGLNQLKSVVESGRS